LLGLALDCYFHRFFWVASHNGEHLALFADVTTEAWEDQVTIFRKL
jgi:hypothetical protein